MESKSLRNFVPQNLGAVDRTVRFVIGVIMIGVPFVLLLQPDAVMVWWYPLSMLIGIYPALSAILGMDPLYQFFNIRSCSVVPDGRNQCGSFPYEVDAMIGHHPIPRHGDNRELHDSDHSKSTRIENE